MSTKSRNLEVKTHNAFETMGSYIVDVFYNAMYVQAQSYQKKAGQSITDNYKMIAAAYISHFSDAVYKTTIEDIYKRFTLYNTSLSYTDWIRNTSFEFVPKDFQESLSVTQRDKILGIVIRDSVKCMAMWAISSNGLSMIIDHRNATTTKIMQDKIFDIIVERREEMYVKFHNQHINAPKTVSESVSLKLTALEAENADLRKKLVHAGKLIKNLTQQCDYLKQRAMAPPPQAVITTPETAPAEPPKIATRSRTTAPPPTQISRSPAAPSSAASTASVSTAAKDSLDSTSPFLYDQEEGSPAATIAVEARAKRNAKKDTTPDILELLADDTNFDL